MRKKIILGTVIFVVLAAIVGAVYFNMNYAVVEFTHGKKYPISTDAVQIIHNNQNVGTIAKCTPVLKKLTNLESLRLIAEEDMDLKYLSEMKNLNELSIHYIDGNNECNIKFETLPDLPNLKKLYLVDFRYKENDINFTLPDDVEYNFDSIETLMINGNQALDFECLKHFKNLKLLQLGYTNKDLTEEQIAELHSRGITVEFF